ncbi:MAG: protease, partial [Bacteroidetes bacterium]|nr:protease [Bacteroidota bacterium]
MKPKLLLRRMALLCFLASQTFVAGKAAHGETSSDPARTASNRLLLLQYPTLSRTQIAFEYGGEIWTVSRKGGQAHRLVTGADVLTMPIFSPDGSMIAYTGTYDHNTDVYVVPANGGEPTRLTFHPGPDVAVGWTPDGKDVLFRSRRYTYSDPNQLYTVPVTGGFPKELPLSMAEAGSYSPHGARLAYVPSFQWEPFWKGYRGGQTTPIWIATLSNSSVVKIPRRGANYNDPMWVGNKVYYLSDQDGPITLFSYNVDTHETTKLIDNKGFDITSASAGPGGIVYSQFGQIYIYDYATKESHLVPVTVSGDLPQLRPYFQKVAGQISNYDISPNGVRAVFQAHGDILTVPTKHGSIENLTSSSGIEDRNPAWSPNGKWIAYFADRDSEYDLYIRSQDGTGKPRKITLGQKSAFYYQPAWSPDSKKIAFSDQKLNLWYVDLTKSNPKPIKIDTDDYSELHEFDESWSPDSRWITYTKVLPNYLHGVFVYSLENHKIHQITNGGSDCLYPVFDRDGKYLYFTSSTNTALSEGWLDMSKLEQPVERNVYALILRKGVPSPLAPKGGFEKEDTASHKKETGKNEANTKKNSSKAVEIDFKNIESRIIPLPIAPADYRGVAAGKTGMLFLVRAPLVTVPESAPAKASVLTFNLKTRKTETLVQGVSQFALSANGSKMLYKQGGNWFVSSTSGPGVHSPDRLNIADMRVYVDPRKQWDEMYHDAWRIERAFFYNPNYDGLDIEKAEKEFSAYLPGIASRDELSFLFREMLSYMSVGHMFIYGGTEPKMSDIKVGLLGANYKVEHDRY